MCIAPEDLAGSRHYELQPRNVAPAGAALVIVLYVFAERAPIRLALLFKPVATSPTRTVAVSPRIRRLGSNSIHSKTAQKSF